MSSSSSTDDSSSFIDPILQYFSNFRSPPLLLAICIGLPSGALYLTEVILVLTNWTEFNSSFFKLFIVRAIPSIWNLLSSYWSFRLPMLFPVFFLPIYLRIPRLLLQTFFFSSYYTYHVENLSTAFLILNRLTSILIPFRHQKIWSWGVPLAISLILLLPLPFNYSIYGLKAEIFFMDNKNISFSFITPEDEYPYSRAASISAVIFISLSTALNCATIVAYRKHQNGSIGIQQQPNEYDANKSNGNVMESRLTKYAVITFFCQIFMGFCFLSLYITQQVATARAYLVGFAIFNFYGLINDIFTLAIPAWSMLWTSSKMRQLFYRKFPYLKSIFGLFKSNRSTVVVHPLQQGTINKMTTAPSRAQGFPTRTKSLAEGITQHLNNNGRGY